MSVKWRTIREDIKQEATLSLGKPIICVSGGADSMFLLDFMSRCDLYFDVFHFQHGIRSLEEEAEDLKVIVDKMRQIQHCNLHIKMGVNLRNSQNQEAEARNQRWVAIAEIVGSKKTLVLTAHHLNDAIETVFLNLMRGNQHKHLNMHKTNVVFPIVKFKPLLSITREEIMEQVVARKIAFHEDITNADNKNERNWMRNVIIPQLEQRRNLTKSMAKAILNP